VHRHCLEGDVSVVVGDGATVDVDAADDAIHSAGVVAVTDGSTSTAAW
jgi:hypothetical protein